MTFKDIAALIPKEQFSELLECKKALYEYKNQERAFDIYEDALNKSLNNEPGTAIVNRKCGECRANTIYRINLLINAREEN